MEKSVIDNDLDLVILEKEYPKLKDALEMKYADIGYEEIKRAINEISNRTFTASRLLARAQYRYQLYVEGMYEIKMATFRLESRAALETIWKDEKRKGSLTEKCIDDYMISNYGKRVLPVKQKLRKLNRDIDILKSLHKRLENRETLLQTYSRLHEKRTQILVTK